jgi:hypothetical protein
VVASFVAYAALAQTSANIAAQLIVSAAGIAFLVAIAQLIGWSRGVDALHGQVISSL